MIVDVIIPEQFLNKISSIGNKTKVKSAYKIYNALYRKSKYKNKNGWFEISSRYLRAINGRYHQIIDFFINNNILEPLTRTILPCETGGDLFEITERITYSSKNKICIHYRFNNEVDLEKGKVISIEINNKTEEKKWYKLIKNSLNRLGYEGKVTRDNFGGRVYHDLTPIYKEELKGKGFCTIDSVASQPRLLYLIMKERGLRDDKYFEIFEKDRDFYLELRFKLGLKDRQEAKDIFMFWALGNGYTKEAKMWELFPEASKFLKKVKGRNYRDSSRYLSSRESKIWINDLLENIPIDFVIPIHDSFIVYGKDANKVLEYCQSKYPELKFKVEEL